MELSAFFAFAFIASITPGPSNVLLATVGARMGILRGVPALLGTAVGTGLVLFIVGFGLGATLLENVMALFVLRIMGIGAILWLAWMIATAPVAGPEKQGSTQVLGFLPAFLLQWLNPKAWIVSLSIVGAFMVADGSALIQAGTLSAIFIFAAILGCFPWLAGGTALRRLLQNQNFARFFNYFLGLSLAASMITII